MIFNNENEFSKLSKKCWDVYFILENGFNCAKTDDKFIVHYVDGRNYYKRPHNFSGLLYLGLDELKAESKKYNGNLNYDYIYFDKIEDCQKFITEFIEPRYMYIKFMK